ncbi:hypothetical protein H696_02366 [Fonticula alba]|uniref:GPI transamidase component PIG-T n=1 Tax=Fonticula alba TaxID=691883 RepID=A0A058ZAI5_FONAL|nr:hypothetical protein H696_02366 [Fonticula alba]KCV71419.1 hypothetical protein H696_02366 [Fonticula alba]|eukprot:XP_009494542.1 hypothetical protein H696_02366 [Fonticula alba]
MRRPSFCRASLPGLALVGWLVLVLVGLVTADAPSGVDFRAAASSSTFREQLVISPTADGLHTFLRAEFLISSPADLAHADAPNPRQHYRSDVYPAAVRQIFHLNPHLEAAALTFSQGQFMLSEWGALDLGHGAAGQAAQRAASPARRLLLQSQELVPTGSRLVGLFRPSATSTPADIGTASMDAHLDASWSGLTNILGGLFCVSSHDMTSERVVDSVFEAGESPGPTAWLLSRSSMLPRESSCTENLSALRRWVLPCAVSGEMPLGPGAAGLGDRGVASGGGLAGILLSSPHGIFSAPWHSLSLFLSRTEGIRVAVDLVVPNSRARTIKQAWGIGMQVANVPPVAVSHVSLCPVASSSRVLIFPGLATTKVAATATAAMAVPGPTLREITTAEDLAAMLDARLGPAEEDTSVEAVPLHGDAAGRLPILVERSLTSDLSDQGSGLLVTRILFRLPASDGPDAPSICHVRLDDVLPWFLVPFLHTLRHSMVSTGTSGSASGAGDAALASSRPDFRLEGLAFAPAVPEHSPAQLRIDFTLAAGAGPGPHEGEVLFEMRVRKRFIHIDLHPPDANRGFEIFPSEVQVECQLPAGHDARLIPTGLAWPADGAASPAMASSTPSGSVALRYRAFTRPLLVYLPLPDFSMPFNVIAGTSTVIALFFGYMFNHLVRAVVVKPARSAGLKARLGGLLRRRPAPPAAS